MLEDLPVWQRLNVTAFLVTGIAGAAPEAMGEPCEDTAGRRYAPMLGQPILYLRNIRTRQWASRPIAVVLMKLATWVRNGR